MWIKLEIDWTDFKIKQNISVVNNICKSRYIYYDYLTLLID